jgi:molecular chaperone DnaK
VGIPPAPRGVPQIEVTFRHRCQRHRQCFGQGQATGKEQSIQITASSGLSKGGNRPLVKDAEMHADEDKKKKELVEASNHADTLIYSTEKSLKDLGDKVETKR